MTEREVAITIDVEGDFGTAALRGVDEVLPKLLDGFDARDVRAVFFVEGGTAKSRPHAVKTIAARGHVVASHSMTHPRFSSLDEAERRRELADSRALLEDLTGAACTGFRAPYFDLPADLGPLLEACGYTWSSSKAPFSPVAFYRHARDTVAEHLLAGSRVIELPVPGAYGLPLPEGLSYRRLFWPLPALAAPPRMFFLHLYDLLPDARDFARSSVWRPFMTFRLGAWSERHFWGWIDDWRKSGARFRPPAPALAKAPRAR